MLDGKSSLEIPTNACVTKGSIFSPTIFFLFINDFIDAVLSNIAIYADEKAPDVWKQQEIFSDLVSEKQNVVHERI